MMKRFKMIMCWLLLSLFFSSCSVLAKNLIHLDENPVQVNDAIQVSSSYCIADNSINHKLVLSVIEITNIGSKPNEIDLKHFQVNRKKADVTHYFGYSYAIYTDSYHLISRNDSFFPNFEEPLWLGAFAFEKQSYPPEILWIVSNPEQAKEEWSKRWLGDDIELILPIDKPMYCNQKDPSNTNLNLPVFSIWLNNPDTTLDGMLLIKMPFNKIKQANMLQTVNPNSSVSHKIILNPSEKIFFTQYFVAPPESKKWTLPQFDKENQYYIRENWITPEQYPPYPW